MEVCRYRGIKVWLHLLLTSALDGGECPFAVRPLYSQTESVRDALNGRLGEPQNL